MHSPDDLYQLFTLDTTGAQRHHYVPSSLVHLLDFDRTITNIRQHFDVSNHSCTLINKEYLGFSWSDELGLCPVFYPNIPGTFRPAFRINDLGSEHLKEVDHSYIHNILTSDIDIERTAWQNVSRLRPGHFIALTRSTKPTPCYFGTLNRKARNKHSSQSLAGLVEKLNNRLDRAILKSLKSHQRVGVCISGGLDSSIIAQKVTLACRKSGLPDPIGLTWMSEPTDLNREHTEHRFVRSIAKQLNIKLEYCPVTSLSLEKALQQDYLEGPIHMTACHEISVMARASKLNLTAIYSGTGGDESISYRGTGYLPGLLREGKWLEWLSCMLFHVPTRKMSLSSILQALLGNEISLKTMTSPPDKKAAPHYSLYNRQQERRSKVTFLNHRDRQLYYLLAHGDIQNRVQSQTHLAKNYNTCYLFPFLDIDVLTCVLNSPSKYIYRDHQSRVLARQLLKGFFDEEIRQADKLSDQMRTEDLSRVLLPLLQKFNQAVKNNYKPERSSWLNWPLLTANCKRLEKLSSPKSGIGKIHRAIQLLQFTHRL